GELAAFQELQLKAGEVAKMSGPVDARVVDDGAVEPGDELAEGQDDAVDHPLVGVVEVEAVEEEQVQRMQPLRRPFRPRGGTRPEEPANRNAARCQDSR